MVDDVHDILEDVVPRPSAWHNMDLALLRASMAEANVVRLRELFPVQDVVMPDVVELPC